ncbi:hypothetical protein DQG23_36365 [Paenibacillus contaminans]|uniref:Uncharacterized protein n=1 Tax=Paenibacillus contaminans TaxID=450362 RepID=A0A329LVR1_9BACL|nr:hypothetical protein DQG23_36365 [Paenibacillus contaminans]
MEELEAVVEVERSLFRVHPVNVTVIRNMQKTIGNFFIQKKPFFLPSIHFILTFVVQLFFPLGEQRQPVIVAGCLHVVRPAWASSLV